jgi:hypothetical protein
MDKVIVNYESRTGTVHSGGLETQWVGIAKCSREFSVHPHNNRRWIPTNQEVTCKQCNPPKKLIIKVSENISIFGIDTDEKARLATIRARILSMLESWEKHAKSETSKKDFYSDLRRDLYDTDDDLHQYMYLFENKVWDDKRQMYVSPERKLPVNEIKHSLDGKVPSYYSYKCCQSNTCKCGRKVTK